MEGCFIKFEKQNPFLFQKLLEICLKKKEMEILNLKFCFLNEENLNFLKKFQLENHQKLKILY